MSSQQSVSFFMAYIFSGVIREILVGRKRIQASGLLVLDVLQLEREEIVGK